MSKCVLFLALSAALSFSGIAATPPVAAQDSERGRAAEGQVATATATEGIANYIQAVDISVAELERDGPSEFDVRVFVTIVDGQEQAVRSVDVIFPGGKEISITREKQDFEGAEHFAAAVREADGDPLSFSYMNIGAMSIAQYGSGTYLIRVNHESGAEQISFPSVDPETGSPLRRPEFPKLTSMLEGTVTSPFSVNIGRMAVAASLFFGRVDRQSEEFLEAVERRIPAGETTTGPIELRSGSWGGDIGVASGNSGVVRAFRGPSHFLPSSSSTLK